MTFGLGMMFALGAVAAVFCWPHRWRYKRWAKALCAAPLAALATAGSRRSRGSSSGWSRSRCSCRSGGPGAYALGLAPAAVVALSAWLFPFSGTQPMSFGSASLPFAVLGARLRRSSRSDWKTVRITAAVYGLGVLLTWLISSQIGSNITRLADALRGRGAAGRAAVRGAAQSRKWYAIVLAFAGLRTAGSASSRVDDIVPHDPGGVLGA